MCRGNGVVHVMEGVWLMRNRRSSKSRGSGTGIASRVARASERLAISLSRPRSGDRDGDLLVYLEDRRCAPRVVRIPDPRVEFIRTYLEMNPGATIYPVASAIPRAKASRRSE